MKKRMAGFGAACAVFLASATGCEVATDAPNGVESTPTAPAASKTISERLGVTAVLNSTGTQLRLGELDGDSFVVATCVSPTELPKAKPSIVEIGQNPSASRAAEDVMCKFGQIAFVPR